MSNFPSKSDLAYWRAKQPVPLWAWDLAEHMKGPSIDELVNTHGGCSIGQTHHAHNLISFIRGWERRGQNVRHQLAELAFADEQRFPRRAGFARKWLARLSAATETKGPPR